MSAIDLMETAREAGFRQRIKFIMFDVARDKALTVVDPPTNSDPDLAFINAILNGLADESLMAVAVVVVNADPVNADDASLKTTVETVWPFFARARMDV